MQPRGRHDLVIRLTEKQTRIAHEPARHYQNICFGKNFPQSLSCVTGLVAFFGLFSLAAFAPNLPIVCSARFTVGGLLIRVRQCGQVNCGSGRYPYCGRRMSMASGG